MQLLFKYTTKRLNNQRDPVWNQTFICPLERNAKHILQLTVWDHDLGGIGNDFLGRVEISLDPAKIDLPFQAPDMFLRPELDPKTGEVDTA